MIGLRRSLLALALLASAAGCPQERPEAARQIPRDHVPPAVSLEPPAAAGRAPPVPASAPSPPKERPAAEPQP